MKIIRHTARDMRQALRAVREQLGEDAVILSSRRTSEGVEITAAIDFDASTLEAGGFANTPVPPPVIDASFVSTPSAGRPGAPAALSAPASFGTPAAHGAQPGFGTPASGGTHAGFGSQAALSAPAPHATQSRFGTSAAHSAQGRFGTPAAHSAQGRFGTPAAHDSEAGFVTPAAHGAQPDFGTPAQARLGAPGARAQSRLGSQAAAGASASHGAQTGSGTLAHGAHADFGPQAALGAPASHGAQTGSGTPAAHGAHAGFDPQAALGAPGTQARSGTHSGFGATASGAPAALGSNASSRKTLANSAADAPAAGATRSSAATNPTVLALTTRRARKSGQATGHTEPHASANQTTLGHAGIGREDDMAASAMSRATPPTNYEPPMEAGLEDAGSYAPAPSYDDLAAAERFPSYNSTADDDAWISEAAREAVAEHLAGSRAPVLAPAPDAPSQTYADMDSEAEQPYSDPVEEIREATLTPLASKEVQAAFAEFQAPASPAPAATEAMGNELKTLRRMLETQLAHLAWNDLTRRAPVHTEILRELTEIGISQDLAEHLVRQLPEDTELTFARRFTIAGLSQYLKVTGDHWLDDGGRVAFAGATGVGKTTTLAKIAVRWVLRHGPRDIALVAADAVRIGAQDQLQSLAQLLGVPVYTPEKFENLPALLSRLNERLILIDTPGSSVRDPQLAGRLAVLSNSASKLETALVLAASTQAGAIEEAVKHFAPANPTCCVLTKLDEAASLGGVLSVLVRARLPVSYMSEGQRVPEDLRPARALELVSAAVRLAKARGAAADEDLLRRRFGKNAHGIS